MGKQSQTSLLADSFYNWWVNKFNEGHPEATYFRNPMEDSFKDRYDTIQKDELSSSRIWLRFGRMDHIITIEPKKDGVDFYDFLPERNYNIRFKPKIPLESTEPKSLEEFCEDLGEAISLDFPNKRYFNPPFKAEFSTGNFDKHMYEGIQIYIPTKNNITKDGELTNGFLEQWRSLIFKRINDFFKQNKGKCVFEFEEILSESYKRDFYPQQFG